jgi:cell filamentation protein, protein adenylyltransferase
MAIQQGRSGNYRTLGGGCKAFYPSLLPPQPAVNLVALEPVLSEANIAVGRLDSITDFLPNPDLFVFLYVRKEAVLSSQIEGTRASRLLTGEFGPGDRVVVDAVGGGFTFEKGREVGAQA